MAALPAATFLLGESTPVRALWLAVLAESHRYRGMTRSAPLLLDQEREPHLSHPAQYSGVPALKAEVPALEEGGLGAQTTYTLLLPDGTGSTPARIQGLPSHFGKNYR